MEMEKDTDFRQTVLSNVQLKFNVFLWIFSLKEVKNTIRKNNLTFSRVLKRKLAKTHPDFLLSEEIRRPPSCLF